MASYDHRSVMRLDGLVDLVEQISCHPSGKVSRVVIIPGSTRKFHRIMVIISAQGVDNILQRCFHNDSEILRKLITVGFAAPRALRPGSSTQN